MALLKSFKASIIRSRTNILKLCSASTHTNIHLKDDILKEVKANRKEEDLPVDIENPFTPEKPQCILCKYDIEPDFRNVRLLSQFVSSYTGRIYGRYITGLCEKKHEKLSREIERAQKCGLMGVMVKDPNFLSDPDLYDPTKPYRVI